MEPPDSVRKTWSSFPMSSYRPRQGQSAFQPFAIYRQLSFYLILFYNAFYWTSFHSHLPQTLFSRPGCREHLTESASHIRAFRTLTTTLFKFIEILNVISFANDPKCSSLETKRAKRLTAFEKSGLYESTIEIQILQWHNTAVQEMYSMWTAFIEETTFKISLDLIGV